MQHLAVTITSPCWLSSSLIMSVGVLLLLIGLQHVVGAREVAVLEVSDVEFPTSNEAAARIENFTIPETTTGLTACIRIKLEYYNNGYTTMFNFNDGDGEKGYSFYFYLAIGWKTGLEMEGLQDGLSDVYLNTSWTYGVHDRQVRWHFLLFREKIEISEWNSFCYGFSTEEKTQIIFHNGLKMHHYNSTKEDSPIAKHFDILLGLNLRGSMSEFNLFGRLLKQEEMEEWTGKCDMRRKPDILKWDPTIFNTTLTESSKSVKVDYVDSGDFCRMISQRGQPVLEIEDDEEGKSPLMSKDRCLRLNGDLKHFPLNKEDLQKMDDVFHQFLEAINETYRLYWVEGRMRMKPEYLEKRDYYPEGGRWEAYDIKTNETIVPFSDNLFGPERHTYTKIPKMCIRYWPSKRERQLKSPKLWVRGDGSFEVQKEAILNWEKCDRASMDMGYMCEFPSKVYLTFKGLCEKTIIDTRYSFSEHNVQERKTTKKRAYVGSTGWKLFHNTTTEEWRLIHPFYQDKSLTMVNKDVLPVGKQKWFVANDTCNEGKSNTKSLLLSSCRDDQFTCDDGKCIDLSKRCNNLEECDDVSDEINCRTIYVDEKKYLKNKPPPAPSNSGKLSVKIDCEVTLIQEINEVQQFLELQFFLSLHWIDKRITFYNIKKSVGMNSLSKKEKNIIWMPIVIFHNTKKKLRTLHDEESAASVTRNGQGTKSGLDINEDIYLFKGSENPLKVSRAYNIRFICDFNMRWYPFDIQTCRIAMVLEGVTGQFVTLLPGKLNYTGPKELTQYYVRQYNITKVPLDGVNSVQVFIVLGRRLMGTFLTVFFPTVLLNIIGHGTNYFKPFFFEAVVTVNLTAMLVLTTMFINVSNNLPKTSYIKMMDIWLIFNLLLPFIEVLIHTYMDTLRSDDDREINHHGRAVQLDGGDESGVIQVVPATEETLDLKISRHEQIQQRALKDFYESEEEKMVKKKRQRLEWCLKFTHVYNPILALSFVTVYWTVGLLKVI